MELGQKLRQARLEAGLTQRQLCGDTITRNMLSLIEHGTARPSMDTLRVLAERLGKPMSYFLEEESPVMTQCREAFRTGDYPRVWELLDGEGEKTWEQALLLALSAMEMARSAVAENRIPHARQLLERAERAGACTPYFTPQLERERLLLLARISPVPLPADDRELLLRAEQALHRGDAHRAGEYLDAAQLRHTPQWQFLRGQVYLTLGSYAQAHTAFQAALPQYPREATQFLEQCCRELGDYQGAYLHACRLRENNWQ